MARRKVREHDGKKLLAKYMGLGLQCCQATPETNFDMLAKENPWLLQKKLVVKPDMLFGKRGKSNLVLLDADFAKAKEFIKTNMNREVEISSVKGAITHFIIEPFVPHDDEYYFSIMSERDKDVLLFSAAGGMDVEANWDKIVKINVPVGEMADGKAVEKALEGKIPADRKAKAAEFFAKAHAMFVDLDLSLLEMNPFTFDAKGDIAPLDLRMEIDDCAEFKDKAKWGELDFPELFGRNPYPEEKFVNDLDSKTGASLKLTILNPEGRIWTMVAGGGASVIYADTVVDLGYMKELANYGEYSGDPNEEETYQYAKTVLDLATRNNSPAGKVLIIGGGIANFTDVANTFKGIVRALREYKEKLKKAKVSIFVRRGGPNYQVGLKLMRELGTELGVPIEVYGPETSMTYVVPLAIKKLSGS
ncbi:MAG: ATP citrate lyase citrate-binding domain-containing protein [Candidatus Micrarchaeota archaeon]